MLATFKSSPNLRSVPFGGLGGCVELGNNQSTFNQGTQQERPHGRNSRQPDQLQVSGLNLHHVFRNSPVSRLDTPLTFTPRTPKTPMSPGFLPTPTIYENMTAYSPNQQWESKDSSWTQSGPRKDSYPLTTVKQRHQTLPVELPGSLLLPSQGFSQTNPPSTPPRARGPLRMGSESSFTSTTSSTPSLTNSSVSASEPHSITSSRQQSQPMTRSPGPSTVPPLPAILSASDSQTSKPFALMNVERLLQVLALSSVHEITNEWIPAMEKELVQFRAYAYYHESKNYAYQASLPSFCEEIICVLLQCKSMCEEHTEEFRLAQETTDSNRQPDNVKISRAYDRLSEALVMLSNPDQRQKIDEVEYVRATLFNSINTISAFVRNQLTFHLHHLCHGLPDHLVQTLRDFDRDKTSVRRKAFVRVADKPRDTPKMMSPVSTSTPIEISNPSTRRNIEDEITPAKTPITTTPIAETNNITYDETTNRYSEMQSKDTASIIQSHFDRPQSSIYSQDEFDPNKTLTPEEITDLNQEVEQLYRTSISRPQTAQHAITTPLPQIPFSPISPIPPTPTSDSASASTPTTHLKPDLSLESKYMAKLQSRDSQIVDLRSKTQNLEYQNHLLRQNIEVLVRQVARLERGLVPSSCCNHLDSTVIPASDKVSRFGFPVSLRSGYRGGREHRDRSVSLSTGYVNWDGSVRGSSSGNRADPASGGSGGAYASTQIGVRA